MKKVAINGFGRIGKLCLKLLDDSKIFKVVAINTGSKANNLPHLLKYDSTYGIDKKIIEEISDGDEDYLVYGSQRAIILADRDPNKLPWKNLDIDIVFECSGKLTDEDSLKAHLNSGAKKVLLSSPGKGNIKTVVLGVNDNQIKKEDKIISNASCTTNCLAPVLKVLHDNFIVKNGFLTTIHAYTSDQNILDAAHKDPRRARSAARSIIPTTTGATKNIGKIIPDLENKLKGVSMRVPVECASMIDLVVNLEKKTSVEEINFIFKKKSEENLKGVIEYTDSPIVSVDIIGNLSSTVFDSLLTDVVEDKTAKVIAWYDNEIAYAKKMCEIGEKMF